MDSLGSSWWKAFMENLKGGKYSLKDASLNGRLREWTSELTKAVVGSNTSMGWITTAKGSKCQILPQENQEFLSLDAVAFEGGVEDVRWRFPIAVFELENSQSDRRIEYSLWKLLCVNADLRILFCYRKDASTGPALISKLEREVVSGFDMSKGKSLCGEILVVVGSRAESGTFPYGFFKEWSLNLNTGKFYRT